MSTLIKAGQGYKGKGRDYYLGPAGKSEESASPPGDPFDGSVWYRPQPLHQAFSYSRDNQMSSPTSPSSSPGFLMTVDIARI